MQYFRRYSAVEALRYDGTTESAQALHQAFPRAISRHFQEKGLLQVSLSFGLAEVKPGQWVACSVYDGRMHVWDDDTFRILHDAV